jgi:methylmalonic aciduria homocystinuria type C protein
VHRFPWLSELVARCQTSGLDLVQPFGLAAFHASNSPELHLETFGRENPLAIVLGNTRAMWPIFLEAVAATPQLAASEHPLDDYVASVIARALEPAPTRHVVHFSHRRSPRVIAIQRIADAAGLAELGPAHLSVHPVHGPWIGLRAVIVFDLDFGVGEAPPPVSHCAGCAKPCVAALDRALALTSETENYGLAPAAEAQSQPPTGAPSFTPNAAEPSPELEATIGAHKLAWLAIRDACPVGQASRYGSAQIAYHYGKFPAFLRARG